MSRIALAGALFVVVLTAGFIYGAINVLTDETWPDW